MERAVSPECNANVSSKRNLKNDCKKTGEKTPEETAIMQTKISEGGDHLFTVYLINNRKNNSQNKEALSQEVKL